MRDERDYFVLTNEVGGPYCALYDSPDDLEIRPPSIGVPAAATWNAPTFRMADSVRGIVVPDVIDNAFQYLMVSERVKALFENECEDEIEYLPFRVRDHRGVEAAGTYYVVNVIGSVECADLARTRGEVDPLNRPLFDYIDELHLDTSKIPEKRRIFRLGIRPQVVIVDRSWREAMEAAGLTGAAFVPMGGGTP